MSSILLCKVSGNKNVSKIITDRFHHMERVYIQTNYKLISLCTSLQVFLQYTKHSSGKTVTHPHTCNHCQVNWNNYNGYIYIYIYITCTYTLSMYCSETQYVPEKYCFRGNSLKKERQLLFPDTLQDAHKLSSTASQLK